MDGDGPANVSAIEHLFFFLWGTGINKTKQNKRPAQKTKQKENLPTGEFNYTMQTQSNKNHSFFMLLRVFCGCRSWYSIISYDVTLNIQAYNIHLHTHTNTRWVYAATTRWGVSTKEKEKSKQEGDVSSGFFWFCFVFFFHFFFKFLGTYGK